MSGLSVRIFCSASTPSPAVPMTWNAPLDSMISAMSLRMKALSSTTRTVEAVSVGSATRSLVLPEDTLTRIHGGEQASSLTQERLDLAKHEDSTWCKHAMEAGEERILCFALEVDDHVSAQDEMDVVERRLVGEQVVA